MSGETPLLRTVAITFDDCYRDNLFAARVLAKDPRFSALAVLGLALGLGVSTAIFTLAGTTMAFKSYYKLPAPQTPNENCVAHNGTLIPVPGASEKLTFAFRPLEEGE